MILVPNSEGLRESNPCHDPGTGEFCSERGIGSPAFKAWFGKSKVVNADGSPLRVFHGTTRDFEAFQPKDPRNGRGARTWFSFHPDTANIYAYGYAKDEEARGGRILPLYVRMENPYLVPSTPEGMSAWARVQDWDLQRKGYDGVLFTGDNDPVGYVFKPEQVKSAIGNRGTWSKQSGKLTESNDCHDPDNGRFCSDGGSDVWALEPPEAVREYEEAWIGGVGDLGDADAAYSIQELPEYAGYRASVQQAVQATHGPLLTLYRAITPERLAEWADGADIGPMGFSLSKSVAQRWPQLAVNQGKTFKLIRVSAPVTAVVMRGAEAEQELVIDANEISFSDVRRLTEFNACHHPGGSALGGQFCSTEGAPDAGGSGPSDAVTLYRGDSADVNPSLDKADPRALFGPGIYLTNNKRIAGDYTTKGAGEEVVFRYGGKAGKVSKQDVIDAYKRVVLARYYDDEGKKSFFPLRDEEGDRSKRLQNAEKLWQEMARTHEVRVQVDGNAVIRKKGAAARVAQYHVPKAWLAKTIDAEDEISTDLLAAIHDSLRAHGDHGTARDAWDFGSQANEDGYKPTFREVYTSIVGGPLREDDDAIVDLRRRFKALGYKGIRYAGGVTMGGGVKHDAYVFWDEQGLKKRRAK